MPLGEPVKIPEIVCRMISAEHFLVRRELGLINIGGPARIRVDGEVLEVPQYDGAYLGRGAGDISFEAADPSDPPRLYYNSLPAHRSEGSRVVRAADALSRHLGESETSNVRTINNYFHEGVVETCQLCMGLTRLAPGSVWNTMPPHTHLRRSEAYLYFDIQPGNAVFHYMGAAQESRHILIANEQAVISPNWSMHFGVGTKNYSFIWSMAGENKDYDDMDHIAIEDLR